MLAARACDIAKGSRKKFYLIQEELEYVCACITTVWIRDLAYITLSQRTTHNDYSGMKAL